MLVLLVLASCRAEKASRPAAAPEPPADRSLSAAPTELTLTGPAAFQGAVPVHCVLSEPSGIQINFRTGDADTPAVALRIDDYRGGGPYAAQVFVTGRSVSGGLVTSTGEVHLEMRQEAPPTGGPVVLLSGKLDGTYQGEAGQGTIEGRFASCAYSQVRGGLQQEASATLTPSHAGSEGDSTAGATEDPPGRETAAAAKDEEPLQAAPQQSTPHRPAQTAKMAVRPRRRAHRAARHRRRR